jgi:hypothetical protein
VAEDPAWAPDGSALAVTGQPAGQPDQRDIYTLRPDGTGLRALAQGPGAETEPAWQPYARLALTLTAEPSLLEVANTTTLTATVANAGPSPAGDAAAVLVVPAGLSVPAAPEGCSVAGDTVVCPMGTVAAGAQRAVSVVARAEETGVHSVTAVATTRTPDTVPDDNTTTTTVEVVAAGTLPDADLSVSLDHSGTTYVGATSDPLTITVANRGPDPAPEVTLATTYPAFIDAAGTPACLGGGSPCGLGTLAAGESQTFTVAMAVTETGTGTVTAQVAGRASDPDPRNNEASLPLTVLRPTLRLLPPIGEPGFVTLAYGEDFPPRAQVLVGWDPGITAAPGPYTVEPDGTIRIPMLIVRRDELGERILVATSTDGRFGPVQSQDRMLVVPRSVSLSSPTLIDRDDPILGRD